MIRLLMAGLLLISVTAVADTNVTHTFEDGEVIKAEEFNENFDDLEAAIEAIPTDAIKAVTSADLDMDGNRVLFSNVYSQLADLPSAADNHGMFAHVHETGEAYYAHAGNWIQLAKQSSISGGSATDPVSALTCTTDQIIKYDGSEWVCADMPADGADGAPGSNGADGLGSPFVWQYSDSCNNLAPGRFCQTIQNNGPYLQFYYTDAAFGLWTVIGNCTSNEDYIYDTYLVDISDVASLAFWRAKGSFASASGGASALAIEQAGDAIVALPFSLDDTVALVPLGCTPPQPTIIILQ